jgi:hypothetical protein
MCDKCKELKEIFQNAVGICERQTAFNEYDKQRKKCLKEQGSLQPVKSKPEIKVEKKGRKSKSKKPEDEEEEEPEAEVKKSTMKPENRKSAKEVEDALNQVNKPKPKEKKEEKPKPFEGTFEVKNKPSTQEVAAGKPKSQCKYYYRGGLCANSQMDKPFCNHPDDQDKCTFKK